MTRFALPIAAVPLFFVLACQNAGEKAEQEPQRGATTAAATSAALPGAAGAAKEPSGKGAGFEGAHGATPTAATPATPPPAAAQGYSLDVIKPIADNCASAKVVLTSAPANAENRYSWMFTRQAMLANQQFKVVNNPPAVPGQVQFLQFESGQKGPDGKWSARSLIAFCADGGTCNQLAAMYKAIVRSSNPQPICGQMGMPVGNSEPAGIQSGGPMNDLPAANETIGLCARLGACMIATDRSTPGDPALECQKAPSSFKTACARKYPCSEVLACMKQ